MIPRYWTPWSWWWLLDSDGSRLKEFTERHCRGSLVSGRKRSTEGEDPEPEYGNVTSSGRLWGDEVDFSPSLSGDNEVREMESRTRNLHQKWKKLVPSRSKAAAGDGQDGLSEDRDSKWPDLPMELLMRVVDSLEYRTLVVLSGVCQGWRDSLRLGVMKISFSWCQKYGVSDLVQSVATRFSRVQDCSLRRCLVSDMAVQAVGRNFHDLRVLDVTGCTMLTDESLFALSIGCSKLEMINFSGCTGITDGGLVALAGKCASLKHLNLCGCGSAGVDNALMALGAGCNELQYLNVGWCERITDRGVTAVALGCPSLAVVDLCGCHYISDRSVMVMAEYCPRLRALNLYGCQNVTDLSMYALAERGRSRLSGGIGKGLGSKSNSVSVFGQMRRSTLVSDRGQASGSGSSSSSSGGHGSVTTHKTISTGYLENLMNESVFGLVSLNLSGCVYLSAVAVQAVCDAYPALHTCRTDRCSLNISGCLNLTSVHCKCGPAARRGRIIF